MQKVEKLKAQITELADLIAPHLNGSLHETDSLLDESELDTLRKAGIVAGSKPSLKRKRSSKHLVFVDSAAEGLRSSFRTLKDRNLISCL